MPSDWCDWCADYWDRMACLAGSLTRCLHADWVAGCFPGRLALIRVEHACDFKEIRVEHACDFKSVWNTSILVIRVEHACDFKEIRLYSERWWLTLTNNSCF